MKIDDCVEVLPNGKEVPIFRGRIKKFDSTKKFAYVQGRFNLESYPRIRDSKFQEINVSLENVRLVSVDL